MPKQKTPELPDTVRFLCEVKHGPHRFFVGSIAQFEDPDAAPYFVRCGWAEFSQEDPQVVFSQGEVDIDPDTIIGTDHPDGLKAGLRVSDVVVDASGITGQEG